LDAAKADPEGLSQLAGELWFDELVPTSIMFGGLDQHARRTVMQAACAAYLFRLEHGNYPTNIQSVVPMLGELPLDPYTGESLPWKMIDGDLVIYSIHFDRYDNGGRDGPDFVIRFKGSDQPSTSTDR